MADGREHKRRLNPIRWFKPMAAGHKLAPADAAVHFNPAKFRRIPGQLPLTPTGGGGDAVVVAEDDGQGEAAVDGEDGEMGGRL
jgi:hypothetical protein